MSKKYLLVLLCLAGTIVHTYAQEDTTGGRTLGEVILSANKWEQNLNEVPNKITKVNKMQILRHAPQTSADLLGQTGAVFIQKSQLGGGSPMIRGFATNRVLLVVDGVRMNNAIYRSGNLQNVISVDPLSLETAEIIFGPGSLIYGSDAIGGVMDFHTLEPRFSSSSKTLVKGSVVGRYSTANKEKTGHADINVGWKEWSLLTSFSYSEFDDLKMGKNGGEDRYLRPEYVERQNNTDVIVPNAASRIQRFSGYDQLNFLQKVRFKPSEHWDLQYSFTYAGTSDAPRYDRLIQYRNGALRFAEWYYDDMLWRMHQVNVLHSRKTKLFDQLRITGGYQVYEEARVDRARGNNNRNKQVEQVDAISANIDATKKAGKGELYYGAEFVHNKVGSFGERTNITNDAVTPYVSRYPDGSKWKTMGVYASYKWNVQPKLTVLSGLRYSYNTLDATFVTTFIPFPYGKAELKDGALTGNAGLVFRPKDTWQLSANISTGYRMPNVDDIGKLFESTPGNITVPNPNLGPEYAWNFEVGIKKRIKNTANFELNGFHTILDNAIVRRPTTFNGEDSILFNGTLSRVEALQNVAKATVWGVQAGVEVFFTKDFSLQTFANWISGKETDDINDVQVPLRHAPPFYGSSFLRYRFKKLFTEFSAMYNSQVEADDLAPSEKAKTDIYAIDDNGQPYSPGWYTLNLKASYEVIKNLMITAGWENMTNQRYRPYSSGIVAAGSNFIIQLRASL
jgi:hemoglobin/transferrin/lactoferrin receptor protein